MTTAMLLENLAATAWPEKLDNSQDNPTSNSEAREQLKLRMDLLISTDPDERLALLESPQWKFDEDHLRQVNTVVETFIDATARQQIREMAKQCLDRDDPPFPIVNQWLTEEQSDILGRLVHQTTVPDRMITFCYAWLELQEKVMAIYALENYRRMPQPDFENFEHTPEDHEADHRFTNHRFANLK